MISCPRAGGRSFRTNVSVRRSAIWFPCQHCVNNPSDEICRRVSSNSREARQKSGKNRVLVKPGGIALINQGAVKRPKQSHNLKVGGSNPPPATKKARRISVWNLI